MRASSFRRSVASTLPWAALVGCSTPITTAPDSGAPADVSTAVDSHVVDAKKDAVDARHEDTGGGNSSSSRPEASLPDAPQREASADGGEPDSGEDARPDVASSKPDAHAPSDAQADATAPSTTLLLIGVANGEPIATLGGAYSTATSSWSAMASLGSTTVQPFQGLGVVVQEGGGGLAVMLASTASDSIYGASWSTSTGWGSLASSNSSASLLGSLVRTPGGEALAYLEGGNVYYGKDVGNAPQTPQEITGLEPQNQSAPAMALTLANDPVVVVENESQEFVWSERSGATWSTPATVPNVGKMNQNTASVALASRVGVDQIVATFVAGQMAGTTGTSLEASSFTGGVWSNPVTLSTSLETNKVPGVLLTALPDGRVALVCWTSAGVELSFFSGTGATASWGAMSVIPDVTINDLQQPVQGSLSIAPGVGGDVLELVFINGNMALEHTRLLSTGTWTTPIAVDATHEYEAVAIASGP